MRILVHASGGLSFLKRRHRILILLGMLPILYILSLGPVARILTSRYYPQPNPTLRFYAPINWAYFHSSLFRRVWDPYRDLWISGVEKKHDPPYN